jgi:SAM-dependent methyltransferase
MDTGYYHASFDRFLAAITAGPAEVLEFACGPGNITRYLLDHRPELRILGTDLAPNMLELAREHNPAATFQLLDARDIRSLHRHFDAIMCGFCLPCSTPGETTPLIGDAAGLLRPGGVLSLSTMEDDPAKSGFKAPISGKGESAYIHYYQEAFLTEALAATGFTVLDLSRAHYVGRDGQPVTDLMLVAQR